jgi:hypothetical protein
MSYSIEQVNGLKAFLSGVENGYICISDLSTELAAIAKVSGYTFHTVIVSPPENGDKMLHPLFLLELCSLSCVHLYINGVSEEQWEIFKSNKFKFKFKSTYLHVNKLCIDGRIVHYDASTCVEVRPNPVRRANNAMVEINGILQQTPNRSKSI